MTRTTSGDQPHLLAMAADLGSTERGAAAADLPACAGLPDLPAELHIRWRCVQGFMWMIAQREDVYNDIYLYELRM